MNILVQIHRPGRCAVVVPCKAQVLGTVVLFVLPFVRMPRHSLPMASFRVESEPVAGVQWWRSFLAVLC